MSKPHFTSHCLVLRDLIKGVDVRQHSDTVVYLCSRIENVKNDLVKKGLQFDEDAIAKSRYSHYKPYVLKTDRENMELAEEILKRYSTAKVLAFLDEIEKSNV